MRFSYIVKSDILVQNLCTKNFHHNVKDNSQTSIREDTQTNYMFFMWSNYYGPGTPHLDPRGSCFFRQVLPLMKQSSCLLSGLCQRVCMSVCMYVCLYVCNTLDRETKRQRAERVARPLNFFYTWLPLCPSYD